MIADPIALMVRYLDGKDTLSNDEREILLFALYLANLKEPNGIVAQAVQKIKSTAGA